MATNPETTRQANPLTTFLTGREFVLVLRLFLGALFILSSSGKVLHPEKFAVAMRAYDLLPLALTNLFALVLAWAELVTGVLLILGIGTRKAAAALVVLLVMFVIAIATTIVRGLVVDCGCFSNEGGSKTGYILIIRNLFLIAASFVVIRFESGFLGLSGILSRRQDAV